MDPYICTSTPASPKSSVLASKVHLSSNVQDSWPVCTIIQIKLSARLLNKPSSMLRHLSFHVFHLRSAFTTDCSTGCQELCEECEANNTPRQAARSLAPDSADPSRLDAQMKHAGSMDATQKMLTCTEPVLEYSREAEILQSCL